MNEAADGAREDHRQQHAQIGGPIIWSESKESERLECEYFGCTRFRDENRPGRHQKVEDKKRVNQKADPKQMSLPCGRWVAHWRRLRNRTGRATELVRVGHRVLGHATRLLPLFGSHSLKYLPLKYLQSKVDTVSSRPRRVKSAKPVQEASAEPGRYRGVLLPVDFPLGLVANRSHGADRIQPFRRADRR